MIAGPADTAFQHIAHSKLPPDRLRVDRPTLVDER